MRIAIFQPDIPQNAGAMMRLAACLAVSAEIIEPCGFVLDDKRLRRAGMDYLDRLDWRRHGSWEAFLAWREDLTQDLAPPPRLILLTTKAALSYVKPRYREDDIFLVGRESAGVPDFVQRRVDLCVRIPMTPAARSLNVALAAAMVLGEALRQTEGFDDD